MEEGGLVCFELTKEEEKSNKRFEQKGFSGHPEGQHWFCGIHYPFAKEYAHLTTAEAAQRPGCDLRETAGPAPHGAQLRPSGGGVPGQGGRPERRHGP